MMAAKARRLSAFNIAALALGLVFLYLPIVILVIFSFNASRLVTVWGGWSLRWYRDLLNDSAMIEAAWMSLRVGATSATIATLLEREGLAQRRVAVEVNGRIVPRGRHGEHVLQPGDRVEIVHALGGG